MPRLSIMSDLHLEMRDHVFDPLEYAADGADVAILAGDIDHGPHTIEYAARIGIPVIVLDGNHEHYGSDLPKTKALMRERAAAYGNVHYLNRDTVVLTIRGTPIRFIGATLWADYKLYGEPDRFRAMMLAQQVMNDHRVITYDGRLFTPQIAAEEHAMDRADIADELTRPHDGPTVVVTHHAPSPRAQPEQYQGGALAPAFCNEMEREVANSGADLWVCGHTHGDCDLWLGETRLVSNQHGYADEKPVQMKTVDVPYRG